jgi:hypothetical protein
MKPAPLYTDAFDLCQWLLGQLGEEPDALARRLCTTAMDLVEALALALKGWDRQLRIEQVDEHLLRLRIELRLAAACGLLAESQLLFALERADGIGRQLGGWIRSLDGL